jgi:hypothetical protein
MNDDDVEAEQWRPIPGWPDYEASSAGRIRLAVDRPNGRWHRGLSAHRRGHVLWQRVRSRRLHEVPYASVQLTKNNRQIEQRVNRLICLAFHGPAPSNKHHAAHKNCNSLDNAERNLYWATPLENAIRVMRAGRRSHGEKHTPSKLTTSQVRQIRERKKAGQSASIIAVDFAISKSTVKQIARGETWRTLL